MKINQLKMGSLLSYGQTFLSILIGILYTPVMIRLLGKSEYGLYNTVSSTIAMLSVLSLGFNSSYIRYYAQYKQEKNEDAISRLNGLFILIFSIIGAVALTCGFILTENLHWIFGQGLTPAEYQRAKILMLLFSINMGISFPASVFTSIISARERFVVLKLVGMLKTVAGPMVTLPLLLLGYGSVSMVTVTLAVSIFADLIYLLYTLKNLHCKFKFRNFEKGLFRSLLGFTIFIAVNMIVDQINNNVDKFLLGRYCGTTAVAVYSAAHTLYNFYVMFSMSVSGVFAPRVHRLVQSTKDDLPRQRQELTALFTKVGRIQFSALTLISSGLIFFGKPFIALWAGKDYGDAYYVALLLILPASIPLIQNIGIEIQRAQNKHQFRSIAYIFMALINLIMTVFLCQRYGSIGAAVGTAISLLLANGLMMNIFYHKRCRIDILYFWKNILRMALGILPALALGTALMLWIDLSNLWVLGAAIAAYCCVYGGGMWLLGFNGYEKNLIAQPFRKLLKKGGSQ